MITVNEAISKAIVSPVREIYARVELYEGSTLIEICNCHDRLISFDIQRVGDTSKFYGFGVCQRLNVHLIDKDRTLNISTAYVLKVSYSVDKENYVYPYPDFHVTEVNRDENTNELSITGYDGLNDREGHMVSEIPLSHPYTIWDYVECCASILGLKPVVFEGVQEDEKGFFMQLPLPANFEGTELIREALDDAAEATQTIYYLDADNHLVFKRLQRDGAPDYAITKEDYITLSSKTNRRLSAICRATELGDNVIATLDLTGTTQYIRDNAFWDNRDDIADVLHEALDIMGGFTINQFDCFWRGNFLLEIGDKIALTTKDDEIVYSYVIDDIVNYNGFFNETTAWRYTAEEIETHANPSTIGEKLKQTYAKVDKVNQTIDLVAGELAAIKMTSESIEQSVSRLDHELDEVVAEVSATLTPENLQIIVEKAVEDTDIDSVKTSTGYTFDADGLHITKDDSPMNTSITEDGMIIYKNDHEVLVANNQGVQAEDLHATTYLIVGDRCRFENYGTSRVGCFYIRFGGI